MAQECKVGTNLYRINPGNNKELQVRSIGGSSYSRHWTAPNGERILDINASGDELMISTDRHNYVRKKSGSINPVY